MDAEAGPPTLEADKDARTWGMLCHLLALCGYIGVPFGWILGPLVMWLIKRDQYSFVNDQGKESLNFQISITIYGLVALLPSLLLVGLPLIALGIFGVVMVIIATIEANKGVRYRYPLTIRLLK